ncbi:MAG: hypothetical protein NT045_02160 [Candidatus Aureabacteria bacterium]|nr:hypothetical protein [Candidatus Auribacterota bacterium]
MAIFVGWTRIEDNKHFVSDVVTGAAIGRIYGHAVSLYHLSADRPIAIEPVVMDNGAGVRARVNF